MEKRTTSTAAPPSVELLATDRARRLRMIRFRAFVRQFTRIAGRAPTAEELRQGLGLPPH
jgi:hypothetical protein